MLTVMYSAHPEHIAPAVASLLSDTSIERMGARQIFLRGNLFVRTAGTA